MNKISCLLFFLITTLQAQNYKYGKVSKEELVEKFNKDYPEAHATILYKSQNLFFRFRQEEGFTQVNEYRERIKIYDKEGLEWANKKIKLYSRTTADREQLMNLNAMTFNIVNGKVDKEKLSKEGVFETKNNEYWSTTSITMPNVKIGSVIDIEYVVESPYKVIDDIIFQYDIPIKKLEIEVLTPEFFRYNRLINPKSNFKPEITDISKFRTEIITTKRTEASSFGAVVQKHDESDFNYKDEGFKINIDNIPGLNDEPFVDYIGNYRGKIIMDFEAYIAPNGEITSYATTWDNISNKINGSTNFGDQLAKSNYYEDDIDALLKGIEEPLDKAAAIFNYVKTKVKWNNFVGFRTEKGVKTAFREGSGNIADINLMLTSILRYAGFPANPVLISTRDNTIPITPTMEGFNYVIAGVEMSEGLLLLDASSPFSTVNILPERSLNWRGRIIRNDGTSNWIDLSTNNNKTINTILSLNINSDLSTSGKVKTQYRNHAALEFRNKNNYLSDKSQIINLESINGNLIISNLETINKAQLDEPIITSYDFKMNSAIEKIGEKLYVTPLLYLAQKENDFKLENRSYPIDLVYTLDEKYIISITIPKGYKVESLPESEKINFNGNEGMFSYISTNNGNKVQISISLQLNNAVVPTSNYKTFKEFYQMIINKENDKLILVKS